jgi:hypothetical protein
MAPYKRFWCKTASFLITLHNHSISKWPLTSQPIWRHAHNYPGAHWAWIASARPDKIAHAMSKIQVCTRPSELLLPLDSVQPTGFCSAEV